MSTKKRENTDSTSNSPYLALVLGLAQLHLQSSHKVTNPVLDPRLERDVLSTDDGTSFPNPLLLQAGAVADLVLRLDVRLQHLPHRSIYVPAITSEVSDQVYNEKLKGCLHQI